MDHTEFVSMIIQFSGYLYLRVTEPTFEFLAIRNETPCGALLNYFDLIVLSTPRFLAHSNNIHVFFIIT